MEKRFHCGHCNEKISRTLYFQHKKLYYSASENTWKKSGDISDVQEEKEDSNEVEDFRLSDDSDIGKISAIIANK